MFKLIALLKDSLVYYELFIQGFGINNYRVQEISEPQEDSLSPFKQISRKLHMKRGIVSRSEAIALYMEEVKKDLMKNLDIDIKDDISMASVIPTMRMMPHTLSSAKFNNNWKNFPAHLQLSKEKPKNKGPLDKIMKTLIKLEKSLSAACSKPKFLLRLVYERPPKESVGLPTWRADPDSRGSSYTVARINYVRKDS
ncbi:hypothetical protein H5410_050555 [Solanum commersonii]|uniref:Uncharacterized protein n=1 Tax=Solanum commersonii TaxID=4109 RepID=A0A9J5WY82_SOLCO|nr:hypothetical protein H5410_050555 [Solanum commersonii]